MLKVHFLHIVKPQVQMVEFPEQFQRKVHVDEIIIKTQLPDGHLHPLYLRSWKYIGMFN